MARGKNEVVLTLSGDSDRLERAFQDTGAAADRMAQQVSDASREMVTRTGADYERLAEATDDVDTKAMGFRDSLTGVEDSMAGVAALSRGDLFEGLMLTGQGVGDLASAGTNLFVPMMEKMSGRIRDARQAMMRWISTSRGMLFAAGGVAAAVGLIAAAYVSWNEQSEIANIRTDNLARDLEFLRRSGRMTGDLVKIIGTDTEEWARTVEMASDRIDRRAIPAVGGLIDHMDMLPEGLIDARKFIGGLSIESGQAAERIDKLDEAMLQLVEQGMSAEEAVRLLGEATGAGAGEVQQLLALMPKLSAELERAEEQQHDTANATFEHVESLRELSDAIRGQTDPLFGLFNAQRALEEAQRAATDAIDEFGRNSPEAEQAAVDLARAELDIVTAIGALGDTTDARLLPALEQMRDDGVLSAGSFELLRDMIDEAHEAAERMDGTRVRITEEVTRINRMGSAAAVDSTRVPRFHTGIHRVPGSPGTEMLAILQAGEQVSPAGGGGGKVVLEVRSAGARLDDVLIEILSRAVAVRGGNVQLVLGGSRG